MKRTIFILMMALGALSACVETVPPAPTSAPGNAIETAVVQTLTAMPTSTLPLVPTAVAETATELPIATTAVLPSPTATLVPPTLTATPVPTTAYQTGSGGGYYAPVTETPAEFIRYYYGQINLGNYPLTWSLLDTNFINNNNGPATGGYSGYVSFWQTVHEVIIQSTYVDSQSGYYAVVTITAMYKWESGLITYSTDTFNLVYNPYRATWMFDSPYISYVPYYYPPVYYTAQTPYQFILYYYSQINQGNYAQAWSLLDANFINQNNNASQGGYTSYVAFWDTITNVSVQSVYILSQGTYTATVSVYAIYTKTTGVVAGYTSTFNLIYDTTRSSWLFDS